MKRRQTWWFFLILLIAGGFMGLKDQFQPRPTTLRMAFPSANKIESYEPSNIRIAYEYLLLENLYSALVEIDPKTGQLLPAAAESFSWIGDELHLKIRDDLKTLSGRPITAKDVVFSLKRIIILAKNTHGNFQDLVCPGVELKNVHEDCPGIEYKGNTVILKPGGKKTILLPMLAAIDFAILPETSVDPKTLAITNYRETSGLYYVANDDGNGHITLKQNPGHFHASKDIAETVELVPFNAKAGESALALFEKGLVDHIPTTNSGKIEDLISYSSTREDVQVHATMKIKNFVLIFTDKGRKRLSLEQRRWLGEKIRESFLEIYSGTPGYQGSREFFPALSEGGLSDLQRKEMDAVNEAIKPMELPSLDVALLKAGDIDQWAKPILRRVPGLNLFLSRTIPDLHTYSNPSEMPDAVIAGTDTGFMEDINLISYSLNAGYLGLEKSKRAAWIKHYMETSSKEERIESLRDLHFSALRNADIVPLVISPFVALSRKPWRMELSELYANNQLWLIKNH
jgi:MarR-like DNA-binding transcriptional regulator SgrR of sgrS sRNA